MTVFNQLTKRTIIFAPFTLESIFNYTKQKQNNDSSIKYYFFDKNDALRGKYLDADIVDYTFFPKAMVYITKPECSKDITDSLLKLGYSPEQIITIDQTDFSCMIDFISYLKVIDHAGMKYRSFKDWQQLVKKYKYLFAPNLPLVYQRVELTITEKCNLRCTHCANLMQYFDEPQNITAEQVKMDFDNLVTVFDYICEILIIGGEPLLYNDLDEILQHMLDTKEKWKDKVGCIELVTNGTITPKESTLNLLKQLDCFVYFSNYGFYDSKAKIFIEKLNEYFIEYKESKNMVWSNVSQLCDNDNIGNAEHKSKHCLTYHASVKKGRFHRCCFLANSVDLPGFLENKEDNFIPLSSDIDKNSLINYCARKTVPSGCSYCTGNEEYQWERYVPTAEQCNKPIPYTKHRKQI